MIKKSKNGIIHGPTIALITIFTVVSLWIFIKPYANKIRNEVPKGKINSKKVSKKKETKKDYNYINKYHIIYENNKKNDKIAK